MVSIIVILVATLVIASKPQPSKRQLSNPIKLLGKCVSDHECEYNQYCDHSGVNPIGSCTLGKELNRSCIMDRYCQSKRCSFLKCAPRLKKLDSVCFEADHSQCVPVQYCSNIEDNKYKCKNRKCSGWCRKDAHCLSNKCHLFRCKRPEGVDCSSIDETTKNPDKKKS